MALPQALGGAAYSQSCWIEVRDDRVRVLHLEARPRTEIGFLTRALAGADLELERRLIEAGADAAAPDWTAFDVVILGEVSRLRLPARWFDTLGHAVVENDVGLLACGGPEFFAGGGAGRTLLADALPVAFERSQPREDERVGVRVVSDHATHTLLGALAASVAKATSPPAGGAAEPAALTDELVRVVDALPPTPIGARLGRPKPLAVELLRTASGSPLLVAQESGGGRCLAAAWSVTWPWALASKEGLAFQQSLWREMVRWLANRRPQAWVATDQPVYASEALRAGQQEIRIRAGVANLDPSHDAAARLPADPGVAGGDERTETSLVLRRVSEGDATTSRPATMPSAATPNATTAPAAPSPPATQPSLNRPSTSTQPGPWTVPLVREAGEWRARLPRAGAADAPMPGTYELVFTAALSPPAHADVPAGRSGAAAGPAARPAPSRPDRFSASTRFVVESRDLERQPPTQDLALLQAAAAATAAQGGKYVELKELPGLLKELTDVDRRRRIERVETLHLSRQCPGVLLGLVAMALGLEWALRRRYGWL